jgi:hypothetical protein
MFEEDAYAVAYTDGWEDGWAVGAACAQIRERLAARRRAAEARAWRVRRHRSLAFLRAAIDLAGWSFNDRIIEGCHWAAWTLWRAEL